MLGSLSIHVALTFIRLYNQLLKFKYKLDV